MTYNIGHMIIAMLLGIVIGVLIVGAVIVDANASPERNRWCNAPCVVYFGENMYEDQFCIDYRGNGTLRVWRDNTGRCR